MEPPSLYSDDLLYVSLAEELEEEVIRAFLLLQIFF